MARLARFEEVVMRAFHWRVAVGLAFVAGTVVVAACGSDDAQPLKTLPPLTLASTTTTFHITTTTVLQYYEVQSGDSLLEIAIKFQTSIEAFMQLNGLTNPDLIQIGQKLQVPPPTVLLTEAPTTLTAAPTTVP